MNRMREILEMELNYREILVSRASSMGSYPHTRYILLLLHCYSNSLCLPTIRMPGVKNSVPNIGCAARCAIPVLKKAITCTTLVTAYSGFFIMA